MRKYISFLIILVFLASSLSIIGFEVKKSDGINEDYEKVRIKKFPISTQCWTFRNFSFYETLDKAKELGIRYLQPYPGQRLSKEGKDSFGHDMSQENIDKVREKLKQYNITLVSYGVVSFENSEESMVKVFEFVKKMGIRTIVTEPVYDDYSLIEKMVKKYDINIAIHNHPSPSKYSKPETVLEHIEGLDSRIGACADTGHWMRSGVNPLEALRLLKGRILDVHLKDLNEFGNNEAYDVPFGDGEANIHDILAELTLQNFGGFIAIEHEKKEDIDNPLPPINKGLHYIKSITYYQDYEEILSRYFRSYSKHGWNHYGPGYFELNQQTGVLKGVGGMGLFWYSLKTLKDFTLDLEYKCADKYTNSGIFFRIPKLVSSNDYIYHSFEVQINDNGKGIHTTAAIYDAEAPVKDTFYPAGEWNHMKIIVKERRVVVELNGEKVLDWIAEPRGKVRGFSKEGYIGLQNHDSRSPIYFRNIFLKEN